MSQICGPTESLPNPANVSQDALPGKNKPVVAGCLSGLEFSHQLLPSRLANGIAMLLLIPRPIRQRPFCQRLVRQHPVRNRTLGIRGLMFVAVWLLVPAASRAQDVQASAGSAANRDKTAQPAFDPGVLVGQVVSADGKPVVEAKVVLRGRTRRVARTDREDRFRFEYLLPGNHSIWATNGTWSPRGRSSLAKV
jgi:hypothetical protein